MIAPPTVRAQNGDYYNRQIVDGTYWEAQNDQWKLDRDAFWEIDWWNFGAATLSLIAVCREYGLDWEMDTYAPDQSYIAWQEGGWDQYWALMSIPIYGIMADFSGWEPRSWYTNDGLWINGSGPLSSQLGYVWAEYPPSPGDFQWSPLSLGGDPGIAYSTAPGMLDEAMRRNPTIETVGYDNVPWYNPWNPLVPQMIVAPNGGSLGTFVWWPLSTELQCKMLNDTTTALAVIAGSLFVFLGDIDRKAKITIGILAAMYALFRRFYCR